MFTVLLFVRGCTWKLYSVPDFSVFTVENGNVVDLLRVYPVPFTTIELHVFVFFGFTYSLY